MNVNVNVNVNVDVVVVVVVVVNVDVDVVVYVDLHASTTTSTEYDWVCLVLLASSPDLPTSDVRVLALSAFFLVRTEREDVILAVISGIPVMVRITPRITRHFGFIQVGALPGGEVSWFLDQRRESFGRIRISTGIHKEKLQCPFDPFDLNHRDLVLPVLKPPNSFTAYPKL